MRHKPTTESTALISRTIYRLLSHYWAGNEPAEIRQMQVEDWLDDMVHFGPDIAAEACAQWRVSQSRRPTPADVVAIATGLQRDHEEREALQSPEGRQMRAAIVDDRERRREAADRSRREGQLEGRDIVNKWAQTKGHADLDAYCASTGEPWVDVYTRIVQEICAASPVVPRIGRFRSLGDLIGGGLPWTGKKAEREVMTAAALGVEAREL